MKMESPMMYESLITHYNNQKANKIIKSKTIKRPKLNPIPTPRKVDKN